MNEKYRNIQNLKSNPHNILLDFALIFSPTQNVSYCMCKKEKKVIYIRCHRFASMCLCVFVNLLICT